jgi:membrane-bound lytic murein transglycosylase B
MGSWLRGHVRLSAGEVRRLMRSGRALEQLPAVAAAFAAGAVTAEQVAVVAAVEVQVEVQVEAVGQGVDPAAVDATLAEVAAGRSLAPAACAREAPPPELTETRAPHV